MKYSAFFKLKIVGHEIQNKNFYILHINYFCYVSGENQYYPAEIALSRFNLQNGVTEKDTYHAMCKPGMYVYMYIFLFKIYFF